MKHNYRAGGVYNANTRIYSFQKIHISSSSMKKLWNKKIINNKQNNYQAFIKNLHENKHLVEDIKILSEMNNKKNSYAQVGNLCEKDVIEKLKEIEQFRDIKIDKNRFISADWKNNEVEFFSTELDGYIGSDPFNIEAIIEVKISKEPIEKVIKKYQRQFQSLMYFFNTDTLYLAHYHNVDKPKLSVVKIESDFIIQCKIQTILKELSQTKL